MNLTRNYIKNYRDCLLVLLGAFALQSCDKKFAQINTNPDATSTVVPSYVFTKAEYDGVSNMLDLLIGTMQYTTSYNDVAGFGSKYSPGQSTQTFGAFDGAYTNWVNELEIVMKALQGDATQSNLLLEAKIWRVYCFSRLTDLYGDIPYSQAAKGYDATIFKPAYDAQKDIYADMLSQLDSCAQALDATKATFGAADLIYGGNTDQWKKFAYSLMLRQGMRMTKVDPTSAQTWVTKAIAGGVILQDADIAAMSYVGSGQDINKNPLANDLWTNDYIAQDGFTNTEGGKYQDVWINYLKANNDPRLPVISIVYNNGVADTSVALQVGMGADYPNAKPPLFGTYSEPNPKTVLLLNSPRLLYTAAESYYLLTEAALRGWYPAGDPAMLFQNGIQAAMRQWALIAPVDGVIPPARIAAYVANNPLNTAGSFDDQMNQIYTEFWASVFPDAQEAFANYRRTGYPALVPNNYPLNVTGGQIFRRMLYPQSEQTLNAESYAAAIARQGPDALLTHIWWDVAQ
ncbi:MAG: SusD/RagB family nutrient-binding outer membrane lipoprotein [Puia sp.]|nr:SusD/RagB family nutrient-binding outer membrane lipoprotein [Puia sp.]